MEYSRSDDDLAPLTQETPHSVWRKPLAQLRRFASPSCLRLALALFPLPWVEIQCSGKPNDSRAKALMQQQQVPGWVAEPLLGWEEERQTWFKQSGLQAALGSYTSTAQDANP